MAKYYQPFIGGWIIDSYLGVGKAAVGRLFGSGVVALSATLHSAFPPDSYVPFYIAILGRFILDLAGIFVSGSVHHDRKVVPWTPVGYCIRNNIKLQPYWVATNFAVNRQLRKATASHTRCGPVWFCNDIILHFHDIGIHG